MSIEISECLRRNRARWRIKNSCQPVDCYRCSIDSKRAVGTEPLCDEFNRSDRGEKLVGQLGEVRSVGTICGAKARDINLHLKGSNGTLGAAMGGDVGSINQ